MQQGDKRDDASNALFTPALKISQVLVNLLIMSLSTVSSEVTDVSTLPAYEVVQSWGARLLAWGLQALPPRLTASRAYAFTAVVSWQTSLRDLLAPMSRWGSPSRSFTPLMNAKAASLSMK